MEKAKKNNIVVIGAGRSGMAFVSRLRQGGSKSKITIVEQNRFYFPRQKITRDPAGIKSLQKIEERAAGLDSEIIYGKVEKINSRLGKVYLSNSEKIDYGTLVIASGAINKKSEIKGIKKEGCCYLSEVNPLEVKPLLKIYQEISVFAATLEGIKLSLFFSSLGKEVRLISDNFNFLGKKKERVENILNKSKVQIDSGFLLSEVIGEKSVKAVKVCGKEEPVDGCQPAVKVFSCQLVFIDTCLEPNLSFFNDREAFTAGEGDFSQNSQIYLTGDASATGLSDKRFYLGRGLLAQKQGKALADYFLTKSTAAI